MAELELAAKPFAETPANCTDDNTPGCCLRDLADAAHDFVGALDRGRGRQLHDAHEVVLVLLRNESARERGQAIPRERDETRIDGDRDGRATHGAGHRFRVAVTRGREATVEALEESCRTRGPCRGSAHPVSRRAA